MIEKGRLVGRMDVLSNDPVDDTDARVVEVRIRLDKPSSELVAGMSYARIEVLILPGSAALSQHATMPARE